MDLGGYCFGVMMCVESKIGLYWDIYFLSSNRECYEGVCVLKLETKKRTT